MKKYIIYNIPHQAVQPEIEIECDSANFHEAPEMVRFYKDGKIIACFLLVNIIGVKEIIK